MKRPMKGICLRMAGEADPKVPVNTVASIMPTFKIVLNEIKIIRKCNTEVVHLEYHSKLTKSDRGWPSLTLARK